LTWDPLEGVTTLRHATRVARVVERHDLASWLSSRPSMADDVLRSFLDYDPKTLDGVLTTADTTLMPWRFAQPLVAVRGVVAGANTLYLCSPRGEQRHYEPLFAWC
jgi:hypothetical protein